ncbi:MAG TPA: TatD family hydrolase [Candidatus Binataceae bacterium]|jgi:TatD DNase family protein|nr:TatD family hydrolase [Candidatus Binataceae bacterium]
MEKNFGTERIAAAAVPSGGLPPLVDTHCHLADRKLQADAVALIARAEAAGVRVIVSVGAIGSIQTDRDTVAIAERHDNIYAVIGVHPHDAASCDTRRLDEVRELAGSKKVVAIGETGMDLHYQNSTRQAQEESLRRHLRLANELSLPVVIHCREAEPMVAAVVKEEGMPAAGGAVHCFTGTTEDALRFLALGFYISFSGIITFKNAGSLRETARIIPDNRLLVETDAPYLTPEPNRGRHNEPAYVALTFGALARLRNTLPSALAAQIMTNAAALFRFKPPPAGLAA